MAASLLQLQHAAAACFGPSWVVQQTNVVPDPEDLTLNGLHAKDLTQATVVYADIDGSTQMVQDYPWWFSAGVYKAYLRCAADILRGEGGSITAYDGDRVMAIFTGPTQCVDAVRAAMMIGYAVSNAVQPAIDAMYPNSGFALKHAVGIDTSQLHAARIGVRGDNDLVWVGRAANYAAKLTALERPAIRITSPVLAALPHEFVFHEGRHVWSHFLGDAMGEVPVFHTTFVYRFD